MSGWTNEQTIVSVMCSIVVQPWPARETHSTIPVSYGSVPASLSYWAGSTCMTCSLCTLFSEVALHVVECSDV